MPVVGEYIARIDERRRTSRRYKVKVKVREGFNLGDLKRATAKHLVEDKAYEDFITMRTFQQDGKATATKETAKLKSFYSEYELSRIERLRKDSLREEQKERTMRNEGGVKIGDTTEYEEATGLPALIE